MTTGSISTQATMVAPFTGLRSSAAFPVTKEAKNDFSSLPNNGGRVQCMKLPMFGCTDSSQVLKELNECKKEYLVSWIHIIGFDNVRQVQCISFIAHQIARLQKSEGERDQSSKRFKCS
ncbi:hypothetical protein L1987_39137 [Smallanthus sonchifolius]|uniref:Uncharacterized protein n=1 Tax=Smallanthus sonchifolius TaxID=185202 RepID=A0ACB9HMH4_9ASTR|nr:hypothetical protein L1987_39137 [Smallanthus sonchifolius]